MGSRWVPSYITYQNNKKTNYNKALKEYGQDVADLVNNWYSENKPLNKLYYATGNAKKEYEDMIKGITNDKKSDLNKYLEQNFAGLGGSNLWLDKYWGSGSDDELVNNFIDTNYNNALEQLDRALKRGTLSQSGYNDALNNLNTQKSGAYSTVGAIGQGIMDEYRNALTEKAQSFGEDVNNFTLNNMNTINPDNFKNSIDNLYNDQKNNFESQFNLMTQDVNPFDVTAIIGNARVGQGVNNTQSDQLLGAIEDNEKKKSDKVGLGNQGLF